MSRPPPRRARRPGGPAPATAELRQAAPVFAALGDPIRLRIVSRLSAAGPTSISQLTFGMGVTRQAITKHLLVLSGAGLVHGVRQGRESFWAIERERLDEARRSLERISAEWDETLARLKAFVEE
ncbi:MAG: metalloregulator ArsR/SmtB family transcription factor [Polyangia bacterium]